MDAVSLARLQFGLTIAFHFLFPPVTIGLAWVIAYMGWRYLRTGEEIYDKMVSFWVKILGLIFAVGVATGITMEFQFGTNWATYSRFVGDIFGSPLAAEGVFAFFLESGFIGVLLLGKNRVSKGFYWFSSLMVALGSTLSAFWIIVANSWQQTPAGYEPIYNEAGEVVGARLTDFWAAVFNPSTLPRYIHTVSASVLTGSLIVAGIGAWYLLKGRHAEFAKRTLRIGLGFAAAFSLVVLLLGHFHSVQVAETQPAKMAVFEALFETQEGAPMVLFGFPDVENQILRLGITVPKLLSFLIHFDPNAEVPGLDQFPEDEWPPIEATYYPYHIMIILGLYFIALPWAGIIFKKLQDNRIYWRVLIYTMPLPVLTMELGWLAAEFGRQPWVVYGLLKTEDAISEVVPPWQVATTIVFFTLVYSLLLGLLIFLLKRELDKGPAVTAQAEAGEEAAA